MGKGRGPISRGIGLEPEGGRASCGWCSRLPGLLVPTSLDVPCDREFLVLTSGGWVGGLDGVGGTIFPPRACMGASWTGHGPRASPAPADARLRSTLGSTARRCCSVSSALRLRLPSCAAGRPPCLSYRPSPRACSCGLWARCGPRAHRRSLGPHLPARPFGRSSTPVRGAMAWPREPCAASRCLVPCYSVLSPSSRRSSAPGVERIDEVKDFYCSRSLDD